MGGVYTYLSPTSKMLYFNDLQILFDILRGIFSATLDKIVKSIPLEFELKTDSSPLISILILYRPIEMR